MLKYNVDAMLKYKVHYFLILKSNYFIIQKRKRRLFNLVGVVIFHPYKAEREKERKIFPLARLRLLSLLN